MTAKIFLGMQVQCTQCHNHPFNDWKQRKFWELNAFFRQTRALRHRAARQRGERCPRSWSIATSPGKATRRARRRFTTSCATASWRWRIPSSSTARRLPRSGMVGEVGRREELGKLIVDSEMLEKTMVNRMWAHFLGYGFTKPIDDLGPHNPPSHPELLEALAAEFRKSSFNIKDLIRWIALSEPYALSSRANGSNERVGRSGIGRAAEVQSLLPAADAGRAAVRVAAGGHAGRQDAAATMPLRSGPRASGCGSSRLPLAPMRVAKRRPSTARFRRP